MNKETDELYEAISILRDQKAILQKCYDLTEEEARSLRTQVNQLRAALETYAMTNESFPEYGNVARDALASVEKESG